MINWFEELSSIDVSSYVKEKNGKNYLPWMIAWRELKSRYPMSYSTVHKSPEGLLVWRDPVGCHVETSVTIVWFEGDERKEHTETEYLPCMNARNQPVPYEECDSMLVNKTVQRSLTKCIARLGIGGFVFAGEDLPESVTKLNELIEEIESVAAKKCNLGEKAKARVKELCIAAEKQANPDMDDDLITGNYKNIQDIDILANLKKQLMAVRK